MVLAPRPGSVSGVYTVSTDGEVPCPGRCDHWDSSTPPRSINKRRVGQSVSVADPYGC